MMKSLLLSLALVTSASATPPEGGVVKTIPIMAYCHPIESVMLDAIMKTWDQQVSMIMSSPSGLLSIFILDNPHTQTASVLVTKHGIPPKESCLFFSGEGVEYFDRVENNE